MLAAGTTLGPYKILAPLGAGGMGEVYRAHDPRLGRDVAVKVLPSHLAATPEVRARFEREARTISQLNHPHICTLHDVGHQDGIDYLVMELLEGQTLSARLHRGALPVAEVLALGRQVAEALDRAHRAGVVHRDLKPGNVMLTSSGAKLMDFGLARAPALGAAPGVLTASPTVSRPLTADGAIVGTFQYMSPEQLEGREADGRTDLWALGCVLYEMATGARAFAGESQASLIAAILKEEPRAMTELRPVAPPALERIVARCLAKLPDARFQSASDLAFSLQALAQDGPVSGAGLQAGGAGRSSGRFAGWRVPAWAAGAAIALIVGAAAGAYWLAVRSVPRQATILDLALPAGVELGEYPSASLSRDGRQFACVAADKNGAAIWLRPLSSATSTRLPGTEGAAMPQSPIWSPDGRYLLFACEGTRIKKLELGSGRVETVWSDSSGLASGNEPCFSGDWNERGDILFSWLDLYRLRAGGGSPERIATRGPNEAENIAGRWLPDGRHYLLYAADAATGKTGVYAGSLGSSGRTLVLTSDVPASYVEPGWLVFTQSGALCGQRFDATALKLLGEPVRLVEGVEAPPWGGQNQWGTRNVLAFSRVSRQRSQLTWFDAKGREVGRVGDALDIVTFDLSRDGAHVAASIGAYSSGTRLGLLDAARQSPPAWLTDGPGAFDARFNREGSGIVFTGMDARGQGVFRRSLHEHTWKPVHLQSLAELGRTGLRITTHDWSADGRFVIFSRGTGELQVASTEADASPVRAIPSSAFADQARFSPDGRWIAFHAFESGAIAGIEQCQVFVSANPPRGEPQRITTHGGVQPMWRADGRELYYLDPAGNLMAVAVEPTAGNLAMGPPRSLFSTGLKKVSWQVEDYAVANNGQRFLVKLPAGRAAQSGFTIVLDWPALLSGTKP